MSINSFKIGDKEVGDGKPCFTIAEVGINHNGDIKLAKQIIKLAYDAGFDSIKFQKRNPDVSVPEHQKDISRETPWGTISYLEYKKRLEFGKEEFLEIDKYCKGLGIIWFASPWDIESIDFLEEFDVPCHKIPSALLTHEEYLKHLSEIGKPVILSTGMSTMEQVDKAVGILGQSLAAILHCTSYYPCKMEDLNLRCIDTLREKYKDKVIGYSGHEVGTLPSVIAVASHKASIIERHVTFNRAAWGTDQAASLEKRGMENLIRDIKNIPKMEGDGNKTVCYSELPVMKKLRKF